MSAPKTEPGTFIIDFTQGKILPSLIRFALPLFLANLLQAVYNVVDMIVVGQVVGETGLSGLSVGGDVLSLLTFLSMGFSSASQIIISQYIGSRMYERLSKFIGTMASFLFLCAAIMTVGCLIFRRQILSLMNTPAEAWDQALAYTTTCMCGLVFIYGYNVVSAIMRGMGDSKRPFMFISIAAVLNLLLDLLFVAVFRWEAFGAALATVMAQCVSFLTAVIYLYRKREGFGLDFKLQYFHIDSAELVPLVKLGIPMAIRSASIMFSKLFVNAWVNSYGVTVSAVTGVGHKVDMFGSLMGVSVDTAGSSMVGQNIGAARYERVKRIIGASFFLNGICFSMMIAAVALFHQPIFALFTDEPAVLLVCLEYVPINIVGFVCSALRNSMSCFVNGCGNYRINFAVAILDGIVARIGLALLLGLGLGFGYFGFWMGNAVAGVMPFVLGGVYYLSGLWKKKSRLLEA